MQYYVNINETFLKINENEDTNDSSETINVKSFQQVANPFSRGPWGGIWRTHAEGIGTVPSTSTIGINASTADSENVSKWAWGEKVSRIC